MPIETWSEQVVVVHLADDPQFTDDLESLEQQFAQPKRDGLSAVLDFAAVHYVNSSNIARLLKLRKLMQSTGGKLVLCGISTQVWSVFLVTGLEKIFQLADDVPTGLAAVQMG